MQQFETNPVDICGRYISHYQIDTAKLVLKILAEYGVDTPVITSTGDPDLLPAIVFEWNGIDLHIRDDQTLYSECWLKDYSVPGETFPKAPLELGSRSGFPIDESDQNAVNEFLLYAKRLGMPLVARRW